MKNNVDIYDNGAAFMVTVNGMIVKACSSLGLAWNHIAWMYKVASQEFTVGKNQVPVKEWLEHMERIGFLDKNAGMKL